MKRKHTPCSNGRWTRKRRPFSATAVRKPHATSGAVGNVVMDEAMSKFTPYEPLELE